MDRGPMIECPACKRPSPDTFEYCDCGCTFYRRSMGKIVCMALGLGTLGLVAGWCGGILWACGEYPGGRASGHNMCGLVVFSTVPAGGLLGAVLGAVAGWTWRSRTTLEDL